MNTANPTQPDPVTALARECAEKIIKESGWENPMQPPDWVVSIIAATLRPVVEERDRLRDEAKLMQHMVITCGIIAEGHGDINPIYQEGGEWDSKQAGLVRSLRAERDRLRAAIDAARKEGGAS